MVGPRGWGVGPGVGLAGTWSVLRFIQAWGEVFNCRVPRGQVSIVRIEFLFFISADVPRQLRRHLIHTPSREWFFQEHLPAGRVHRLPEFERPRFLQPLGQRAALIVETQSNK